MKTPFVIALSAACLLALSGALGLMNNACKTSRHTWCAPASEVGHHVKTAYR